MGWVGEVLPNLLTISRMMSAHSLVTQVHWQSQDFHTFRSFIHLDLSCIQKLKMELTFHSVLSTKLHYICFKVSQCQNLMGEQIFHYHRRVRRPIFQIIRHDNTQSTLILEKQTWLDLVDTWVRVNRNLLGWHKKVVEEGSSKPLPNPCKKTPQNNMDAFPWWYPWIFS